MSITQNIASLRKQKGYTQEELGEKLGVSNQAVSRWELGQTYPDILLLPQIAALFGVTLDALFADNTIPFPQTDSRGFNMDAVHSFPQNAQALMVDTLYRETNLTNCNTWDILKVQENPNTQMYEHVRAQYTLGCLSDTKGAAFISDTLTMLDANITPFDIGPVFDKNEVASGMKKLADPAVRTVLSHVCTAYFQSACPFDSKDPQYFAVNISPKELSRAIGLSEEDVLEAFEKLISLHIIEISTENGTQYLLHKVKAIEAAVTLRLVERFLHNEVAMGCGEFFSLVQH